MQDDSGYGQVNFFAHIWECDEVIWLEVQDSNAEEQNLLALIEN